MLLRMFMVSGSENNKFDKLKILGLTATPINANSTKEKELINIYDNEKAIFTISITELMKNGILSRPLLNPISLESGVNIDGRNIDGRTLKEQEDNINQLLAEDEKRNIAIIETYRDSLYQIWEAKKEAGFTWKETAFYTFLSLIPFGSFYTDKLLARKMITA